MSTLSGITEERCEIEMAADLSQQGPADLALTGGRVYTLDAARRWAQALAVKDGCIVAVGADGEVGKWVGEATEVVDLDGRTVLPGFQDAHIHPPKGGLNRLRCSLYEARDPSAYLEIIATYARAHPDVEWILGGGWSMDAFPGGTPTREMLDGLVPDRPVFLVNRDGHGAWVNSRALELAGLSAATPDPVDGRIEREPEGEPTGTLHEGAMDLVQQVAPQPDGETYREALQVAQRYLTSLGITAWQDAWVTPVTERAYRTMDLNGELKARVVGSLWWERDRGEEQISELIVRRAESRGRRYRANTVKIMLDGVCENFTAAMLEPYLGENGQPTANTGLDFVDPEALKGYVTRLDAEGFQVHFHAIGDRAVRSALDAVAAARRANGWNDARHHISHVQVVHPIDLPRFRQLGVIANAQPYWACEEGYQRDLTIPFLGPERSRWQYPFRSLFRHGANLAFGSDWPVSTPDPLKEIEVAVNRVAPYHREMTPFLPEERLDLPTALAAFTIGSAYVNHLDELTGSIEAGKLADLVVLDRDLFSLDAGPIGDASVTLTLIEGEIVYRSNLS
jgi:predicted amidohydrolase YtcJ